VITHPEKVLFPADDDDPAITKGELAAYYEAIAPVMLPHIRARPVTMERYPAGIDKKGFWQKDVSKGFPEWLQRVEVPKKDGTVHHPLVTDTRSLLWLANQNPAYKAFHELFNDVELAQQTIYKTATGTLDEYFATRPAFTETGTLLAERHRIPTPQPATPDEVA